MDQSRWWIAEQPVSIVPLVSMRTIESRCWVCFVINKYFGGINKPCIYSAISSDTTIILERKRVSQFVIVNVFEGHHIQTNFYLPWISMKEKVSNIWCLLCFLYKYTFLSTALLRNDSSTFCFGSLVLISLFFSSILSHSVRGLYKSALSLQIKCSSVVRTEWLISSPFPFSFFFRLHHH